MIDFNESGKATLDGPDHTWTSLCLTCYSMAIGGGIDTSTMEYCVRIHTSIFFPWWLMDPGPPCYHSGLTCRSAL